MQSKLYSWILSSPMASAETLSWCRTWPWCMIDWWKGRFAAETEQGRGSTRDAAQLRSSTRRERGYHAYSLSATAQLDVVCSDDPSTMLQKACPSVLFRSSCLYPGEFSTSHAPWEASGASLLARGFPAWLTNPDDDKLRMNVAFPDCLFSLGIAYVAGQSS